MKAYGQLIHGKNLDICYELEQPETLVGRSETCGIQLEDPYVSRRQARIVKESDRVFIENLGRNPILVNGEPISKSVLQSGDMILFGRTQVVFQLISQDPAGHPESEGSDLDPERTFLLREHQPLRQVRESVTSNGWKKNIVLAWIALGLTLFAIAVYVVSQHL